MSCVQYLLIIESTSPNIFLCLCYANLISVSFQLFYQWVRTSPSTCATAHLRTFFPIRKSKKVHIYREFDYRLHKLFIANYFIYFLISFVHFSKDI